MAETCGNPSCAASGTKRCGGCKLITYCSGNCQAQDWRAHKRACKRTTPSRAPVDPPPCSNAGCTARPDQVTLPCVRCNRAKYCTTLCQREDWEGHKRACQEAVAASPSSNVQAVMIHSHADGGVRYSDFAIPRDHYIFSPPTSAVVPISAAIGFPLLVQRPVKVSERGPAGDNPHATWLMIDPGTGFAPAEWQGRVGNVIVARPGGEALDMATLGAITDYVSDILDTFGDGGGAARKYYNRGRLDKFIADHLKMQEDYQAFQSTQGRG